MSLVEILVVFPIRLTNISKYYCKKVIKYNLFRILNDEDEDTKEDILKTPNGKSQSLHKERFDSTPYTNEGLFSSGKPSKHVTPFGQRREKFVVRFSINGVPDNKTPEKEDNCENDEDAIIKKVQPLQGCSLTVLGSGSGLEDNFRFMHDKVEDRVFTIFHSIEFDSMARSRL